MAIRFEFQKKGQYHTISKIEDGVITATSDDPDSPDYGKAIDGKTNPLEIFNEVKNKYPTSANAGVFIPPVIVEQVNGSNTFTYTKANHNFPIPSAVAWTGTDWVAADKDTMIDVFVIVSATTNTFTVGLPGCHEVAHSLGNDPGPIYLGDPPNNLSRTAPPTGQVPKKQIILGQVLNSNHLWIQPEWRAV